MNIDQLKDKKVAILGVGMEGIAVADFVLNHTQEITLLDKLSEGELRGRAEQNGDEKLLTILDDNRFDRLFGPDYLTNLNQYDIIFRSPGIPYLTSEIQSAKENGVVISSQIKLFFDLCPCQIIGVTGTKGKGTTASLIFEILKKNFQSNSQLSNEKNQKRIYLAGNIGEPAITLIDKLSKDDIAILELSSFQLQDLEKSPHIAAVLNISIDHLDYHNDETEYKEAKVNIVKYQKSNDYALINQDYLTSFEFAAEAAAKVYFFSAKDSVDQGAYIRKTQISNIKSQNNGMGDLFEVVLRIDDQEEIICRSNEVQLIGKHNLENIAAASVAAKLAGADIDSIKTAAREFKGLPHRLEFVAEINEVKYYNDSFATNPAPTMAAINSFTEPLHLILGGSSKGASFDKMAELISKSNIASVNLIGVESEKIAESLKRNKYENFILISGNIDNTTKQISDKAKPGEVVLFSPACASFDMFKNYKDRGEKFKKAVYKLNESS